MKRRKRIDKFKVASAVLSLAIVGALVFGIVTVVNNIKDNAKRNYNVSEFGNNEPETQAKIDIVQRETQQPTQKETKAPVNVEAPTKIQVETVAPTQPPVVAPQPVAAPSAAKAQFSFGEADVLEWPVKGDLVLKYNMESTVYFPTLQQYKCNPAISISATEGTQVKAAAAGKVIKVSHNEETGNTIVMDIGDGYRLTYGQLRDITVKEGSVCMAGDIIGTVDKPSAYYVVEGANLYFAMEKDGLSVDPTLFLAE